MLMQNNTLTQYVLRALHPFQKRDRTRYAQLVVMLPAAEEFTVFGIQMDKPRKEIEGGPAMTFPSKGTQKMEHVAPLGELTVAPLSPV